MSDTIIGPQVQEALLRGEASKRAVSDPLPGPLVDAFAPLSLSVEGTDLKVRPLVAYDWALFKLIKSPIYLQMLEVMQSGENAKMVEPTDQEVWDAIYILT